MIFSLQGLAQMKIIPYFFGMTCFYRSKHNLRTMTREIAMMMYAQ